jgi:hypothetical protein
LVSWAFLAACAFLKSEKLVSNTLTPFAHIVWKKIIRSVLH